MVSRRDVLRIAVAGVAGLVVGSAAGFYAREGEVSSLKKRVEDLMGKAGVELEDEIDIYNWTWYANLNLIEEWAKENNIKLVYDFYESNDELVATLETGAVAYDIVVPSASYIPYLIEKGYLQEIDLDKIPNFEYVPEEFKGLPYDPENRYTVIYSYGTTGIGYNADFVPEGITSWADLFDVDNPDSVIRRHAGKVTMLTESTEVIASAAIYLGYPAETTDRDQLEDIADLLIKQKKYLYGYVSTEDYMEELPIGSRYYISQAWNGDIAGIVYASDEREVLIEKYYENIKYVVPEEGAVVWFDNFAIPINAKHVEAAHAFINWFLDPVISAIHTLTIKYPYPAGIPYVPKEIAEDPMIFTPKDLLKKLYWFALSPEEKAIREEYWNKVQAASV